MYTQCPECRTIFKLAAAELGGAHGSVRCGHCNAVFDALRTVAETLPPEPIGDLDTHTTQSAPPQLGLPVFRPAPRGAAQGALLFDPDDRPRVGERRGTDRRIDQRRRSERPAGTPAFARPHPRRAPQRNWPWLLASLVLLAGLGGEIAWAQRATWIDDATLRPWLDRTCAALGCRLPLQRDPSHLQLLSRDIRPHPSVPGALIISATLRNTAAFAQPFPVVEITLSDLDENRIAMRRFRPAEYLNDSRTIAAGLAPGATTALVFEVVDPGKNAVAFEFKFE